MFPTLLFIGLSIQTGADKFLLRLSQITYTPIQPASRFGKNRSA
jgi:hypothetical protein